MSGNDTGRSKKLLKDHQHYRIHDKHQRTRQRWFGKREGPFTEQIKLAAEVIKQEIMNSIRFFTRESRALDVLSGQRKSVWHIWV